MYDNNNSNSKYINPQRRSYICTQKKTRQQYYACHILFIRLDPCDICMHACTNIIFHLLMHYCRLLSMIILFDFFFFLNIKQTVNSVFSNYTICFIWRIRVFYIYLLSIKKLIFIKYFVSIFSYQTITLNIYFDIKNSNMHNVFQTSVIQMMNTNNKINLEWPIWGKILEMPKLRVTWAILRW